VGILAPLFLIGLAALAAPLILHLVRRTPRGQQTFSSLMFLTPSPPRLTRRSRLDQILLLLLRLGALALLALAFARPFLREAATLATTDLAKRRVAIAIDASASMRRADLWQQAMATAQAELDDLSPHDEVALFTFTESLQTVVPFDSAAAGGTSTATFDVVRQRLSKLRPTWQTADLGSALVALAGEMDAAGDAQQIAAEPQIVLISDFQQSSKTGALQGFEWPDAVRVVARPVQPQRTSNAYVHLLPSEEDATDADPRVRVVNASDSTADQFFVGWGRADPPRPAKGKSAQAKSAAETAIYVPPGQSRVVRLPRPAGEATDRLMLRGDDHDFDNTHYVVPREPQAVKLLYIGADSADDVQGMQYYLRLGVAGDPLRQVEVLELKDGNPQPLLAGDPPPLVVATRELDEALARALREHVERGGTLVLAPRDLQAAKSLPQALAGIELGEEPLAEEDDFALLGEIDFTHPLFAALSGPRYSDFTKIHFWRHRPVVLGSTATVRAIARFENGDPAVLEQAPTGDAGRILVFASGWHPDDSQLALSSKFVALVGSLLDLAFGGAPRAAGLTVGEPAALTFKQPAAAANVQTPSGDTVKTVAGAEHFSATNEPGVYRATSAEDEIRFAVNLATTEGNTAPLPMEQLEQLGVRMGTQLTRAERLSRIRQQRDTELEGRQKVWRWMLVGVLGLLVLETWWASRAAAEQDTKSQQAWESA
jgi:hypothetical protein